MLRPLICLLAAQAAFAAAKDEEKPCTTHGERDEYFDLSPLKARFAILFDCESARGFNGTLIQQRLHI